LIVSAGYEAANLESAQTARRSGEAESLMAAAWRAEPPPAPHA